MVVRAENREWKIWGYGSLGVKKFMSLVDLESGWELSRVKHTPMRRSPVMYIPACRYLVGSPGSSSSRRGLPT